MKTYKTLVCPGETIGLPAVLVPMFFIGITILIINGITDWLAYLAVILSTVFPTVCIAVVMRKNYEVVHMDYTGIYTKRVSFRWDEDCYQGVCIASVGRYYTKCLYFSKEPISDTSRILYERNKDAAVVVELTKRTKRALKTLAPDFYDLNKYEIEKKASQFL